MSAHYKNQEILSPDSIAPIKDIDPNAVGPCQDYWSRYKSSVLDRSGGILNGILEIGLIEFIHLIWGAGFCSGMKYGIRKRSSEIHDANNNPKPN